MKSLKIAAFILFTTISVNAQDLQNKEVPQNLKNQFEKDYPNATEIEWEKEDILFKVEFDIEKKEQEIWFDESGTIIKTERELTKEDLPKAISSEIKSSYASFKIEDIEMKKENDKVTYEIELKKGWTDKTLIFDESGTILQK